MKGSHVVRGVVGTLLRRISVVVPLIVLVMGVLVGGTLLGQAAGQLAPGRVALAAPEQLAAVNGPGAPVVSLAGAAARSPVAPCTAPAAPE
jgi:hypothetical protein